MSNTYKNKDKKVEAIQWSSENIDAIRKLVSPGIVKTGGSTSIIMTKYGGTSVSENDYVVKDGESISTMNKDEFEKDFKKVK